MTPDLTLVWRQFDYWRTVLARTWRGLVVSSIVLPLFYVVSMGVLLGRYVSGVRNSTAHRPTSRSSRLDWWRPSR